MDDQYTWKQFKDAVLDLLTVDKDRDGTSAFRDSQLRQAVISLQSIIPEFQIGHEAIYHAEDVVGEGYASRGTKPPMSVIEDVWLVRLNDDNKTARRYPLHIVPWENRFALVNANESLGQQPSFTIDPRGYTFYVYPEIKGSWLMSMFWTGQKLEFQDDEATPFSERMVAVVADFVKAKLIREYEKDIALYESYMRSYNQAKPILVVDAKERSRVKFTSGEGGDVLCGGRMCETRCLTTEKNCRDAIVVGSGEPTENDVPDKSFEALYKDRESGALWTWDVQQQKWI